MPKRPVSAKVSGTSVCHAFTFALTGRVFGCLVVYASLVLVQHIFQVYWNFAFDALVE